MKNGQFQWLLVVALVVFALFAILAAFAPPPARSSPLPLNKWSAIDYLGAILTAQLLLSLLTARGYIAVTSEAEREILLTCPVSMQEFVAALALRDTFLTGLPNLLWTPIIAYSFNGGNAAKSLLLVLTELASIYFLVVLQAVLLAATVGRRRLTALRISAAVYASAALVHSLATMRVSPLLSLPYAFMARPIVFCFTISEPPSQVAFESLPLLAAASALTLLLLRVSHRLHPEYVKLAVEAELEASEISAARPIYCTPRLAIYRVLLLHPLCTRGHAIAATLAVALPLTLGRALYLLAPAQGFGGVPSTGSLLGFSVGFLFLILASIQSVVVMASLAPIWVYRVNLADMRSVVNAVTLRLTIYGLELSIALSLFLAAYTGRLTYLLLPLAALPAATASAVATVAFFSYVMPRKRLVRRSEAGLTALEQTLSMLLFASSAIFIIPLALFVALVDIASQWLGYYLAAAVALAATIHVLGVEFASELLRTRDVAS